MLESITHIHTPTGNIQPPIHLSWKSLYRGKNRAPRENPQRTCKLYAEKYCFKQILDTFLYCLILRSHLSSHAHKYAHVRFFKMFLYTKVIHTLLHCINLYTFACIVSSKLLNNTKNTIYWKWIHTKETICGSWLLLNWTNLSKCKTGKKLFLPRYKNISTREDFDWLRIMRLPHEPSRRSKELLSSNNKTEFVQTLSHSALRKMELYVFMFMLAALVSSENKGKSVDYK